MSANSNSESLKKQRQSGAALWASSILPASEDDPSSLSTSQTNYHTDTFSTMTKVNLYLKTFVHAFKEYLLETGLVSFQIAMFTLLCLVFVHLRVNDYHGTPSIYRHTNLTVIPMSHCEYQAYFVNPRSDSGFDWFKLVNQLVYSIGVIAPSYIVSIIMFPTKEIKYILVRWITFFVFLMLLFGSLTWTAVSCLDTGNKKSSSYNPSYIASFVAAIFYTFVPFLVAVRTSEVRTSVGGHSHVSYKGAWALFKFDLLFVFIGVVYQEVLMKIFFMASTSSLERMLIRGPFHAMCLSIFVEAGAKTSALLSKEYKLDSTTSHLIMIKPIMMLSILGRFMQGSAPTFTDSIIFEAMGTLAELFTADELLRGRTPLEDYKNFVRYVKRKFCGGVDNSKVQAVVSWDNSNSNSNLDVTSASIQHALSRGQAGSFKAAKVRTKDLAKFCGTSMILLNICEASAIVTSSAFWLVNRRMTVSAIGALGSPLSVEQVAVNFVIMVVGEWVVTDSIAAYCSHHWEQRYTNNIPQAWQRIRRKQSWLKICICIASLIGMTVTVIIPDEQVRKREERSDEI
ncbi:hypothetical protein TL16_g01839 [Triparma laevis f. inornata]|uniref:Uncharacterized protein n=1 Tax=Triparma laevis f. inornata TaxID=1714386 RepID=A0A9W7DYD2_9STRA|nr:hypothetical protein TL16_g01839 [Triparma laevis f. inornata]